MRRAVGLAPVRQYGTNVRPTAVAALATAVPILPVTSLIMTAASTFAMATTAVDRRAPLPRTVAPRRRSARMPPAGNAAGTELVRCVLRSNRCVHACNTPTLLSARAPGGWAVGLGEGAPRDHSTLSAVRRTWIRTRQSRHRDDRVVGRRGCLRYTRLLPPVGRRTSTCSVRWRVRDARRPRLCGRERVWCLAMAGSRPPCALRWTSGPSARTSSCVC